MTRVLIDHEAPLFTFDDGPSEWTPQILDLLSAHNQRASFFLTGMYVARNADTIRRAYADGHRIGNHAWSHRRLTALNDDEVRAEIMQTQTEIRAVLGVTPRMWRAPFFDTDDRVLKIAAEFRLRHEDANLIPEDWMATDPEALAAVILDEIGPGSIVSLHDGVPPDGGSLRCTDSRAVTVEALRLVLEAMAVRA